MTKRVIPINKFCPHEIMQRYYMWSYISPKGYPVHKLISNTILIEEDSGEIILKINQHGFRGDEIPEDKKLIFIWGDSCVFGALKKSWTDFIKIKNCFIVNAGIEGNHILSLRDHFLETINKFQGRILCHYVYGSWHPLYRKFDKNMWMQVYNDLSTPDNLVILSTLPSPLRGLKYNEFRELMMDKNPNNNYYFLSFLGELNLTEDIYFLLQENLKKLDELIFSICSTKDNAIFFDLAHYYACEDITKWPELFFDAIHPRDINYSTLAHYVEKGIKKCVDQK